MELAPSPTCSLKGSLATKTTLSREENNVERQGFPPVPEEEGVLVKPQAATMPPRNCHGDHAGDPPPKGEESTKVMTQIPARTSRIRTTIGESNAGEPSAATRDYTGHHRRDPGKKPQIPRPAPATPPPRRRTLPQRPSGTVRPPRHPAGSTGHHQRIQARNPRSRATGEESAPPRALAPPERPALPESPRRRRPPQELSPLASSGGGQRGGRGGGSDLGRRRLGRPSAAALLILLPSLPSAGAASVHSRPCLWPVPRAAAPHASSILLGLRQLRAMA
ncbi:hypothetical protein BRADI_2g26272v3 [Brachypodium distachyon]|uniref:Uncharacterized protein n=1 Tax=Brachypodium distachyon TaxID=15368 RepID=A0A0Q3QZ32_BRADI|nr:hypothetical protein BRADI_2g26272v3 [Brachypodium distachyon]